MAYKVEVTRYPAGGSTCVVIAPDGAVIWSEKSQTPNQIPRDQRGEWARNLGRQRAKDHATARGVVLGEDDIEVEFFRAASDQ